MHKLSAAKPPYTLVTPYHSFRRADGSKFVPGQAAKLVLDILPTSHLCRKGNRIRVTVACADRDHFVLIPKEPPVITMHRGLSRIDLPVVAGK